MLIEKLVFALGSPQYQAQKLPFELLVVEV